MSADPTALADGELLDLARAGRDDAFAELWARHAAAAGRLARQYRGDWEADDLVSEAYVRVLDLVRRGRGPSDAFRPYLFAVVRSVAQAWSKRTAQSVDDFDALPDPASEVDQAVRSLESTLTLSAFQSLPERQRAVLWYTEVEGMKPQEVAPLLGMTANGVSALAYRSREALRTQWIQAHIQHAAASGDCEWTLSRLADYTRGHLTERHQARAEAHLANCASCQRARAELNDVSASIAIAILAPVVGLGAGIGYLGSGAAPATAAVAGGTATATGAALAFGTVGKGALALATVIAITAAVIVNTAPPAPSSFAESPDEPVTVAETAHREDGTPTDRPGQGPTAPPTPGASEDLPRPGEQNGTADPTPLPGDDDPSPPANLPPSAQPVAHIDYFGDPTLGGQRPDYWGSGIAGSTIQLTLNDGTPVTSTTVGGNGNWTIPDVYGISPAATGFKIVQTEQGHAASAPVAMGPYSFAPKSIAPANAPCGAAGLPLVKGWDGETISVRLQTGGSDTTQQAVIGPDGRYLVNTPAAPYVYTIVYSANPGASPAVISGCN